MFVMVFLLLLTIPVWVPAMADIFNPPPDVDVELSTCFERIQSEAVEPREHRWLYRGDIWTIDFEFVPASIACLEDPAFRSNTRLPFTDYVAAAHDDAFMASLGSKLVKAAEEEGLHGPARVNFIAGLVQHLDYTADNVTTGFDEWPKFPLETLYRHGGDCEDTAILLASILRELHYDVVLLQPPGHMAVGVSLPGYEEQLGGYDYNGRRYAFLETTDVGWELGAIPDPYLTERALVHELQ